MPTSIRVSTLLNSGISRNFGLLLSYMGPYDHGQFSENIKLAAEGSETRAMSVSVPRRSLTRNDKKRKIKNWCPSLTRNNTICT